MLFKGNFVAPIVQREVGLRSALTEAPFFIAGSVSIFYLPWILKNLGTKITIGNNFTRNQRLSLKNKNKKTLVGLGV